MTMVKPDHENRNPGRIAAVTSRPSAAVARNAAVWTSNLISIDGSLSRGARNSFR